MKVWPPSLLTYSDGLFLDSSNRQDLPGQGQFSRHGHVLTRWCVGGQGQQSSHNSASSTRPVFGSCTLNRFPALVITRLSYCTPGGTPSSNTPKQSKSSGLLETSVLEQVEANSGKIVMLTSGSHSCPNFRCFKKQLFKGIVHPKMKITPWITPPQTILGVYDFLLLDEYNWSYNGSEWGTRFWIPKKCIHPS